jgi:thiol:disulfide interchange protein DsbD
MGSVVSGKLISYIFKSNTLLSRKLAILLLLLTHLISPYAMSGVLDTPSSGVTSKSPRFPSVVQAFKVKWTYDGNFVRGEFTIAPGCYLYQDRFKLKLLPQTQSETITNLGKLDLPLGEMLEDPFLGGMHTIYRDKVFIAAPIIAIPPHSPPPSQIEIEAVWQGCAEAGLCYPPVHKTFQLSVSKP